MTGLKIRVNQFIWGRGTFSEVCILEQRLAIMMQGLKEGRGKES